MYTPEAFREDDREAIYAHAVAHPFATVISWPRDAAGGPHASHLPLLVDEKRSVLRGHLARANPQTAHLASGAHVLAIYHGPHAYVSPSVYEEPGVPTWNYVAVHAHGRARVLDETGLRRLLDDMVARFDASDWRARVAPEVVETRLAAIAAFEIDVERIEGKWKLSQNRSARDRERVVDWLERGDSVSREVAALMRRRG
jgi:transcriptional regulator